MTNTQKAQTRRNVLQRASATAWQHAVVNFPVAMAAAFQDFGDYGWNALIAGVLSLAGGALSAAANSLTNKRRPQQDPTES